MLPMRSSPIVLLLALASFGQSTPTLTTTPQQQKPSTSTLTISTTTGWTDTGIDIHPGELIQVTATAPNAQQPGSKAISTCDPQGVSGSAASNLPVANAAPGALIGKINDSIFEVGPAKDINAIQQGRLFLGVNSSGAPPCRGTFAVTFAVKPSGLSQGSIKNKLATAAQTWLGGQFGTAANAANSGSSTLSGASNPLAAAAAKVIAPSSAPIDPKLRDIIDKLPRRVNDDFHHEGDMVNFVIVGSQSDLQAALQSANWFVADTNNANAVAKAVMMTYHKQDYLQMPMSILYLFGRPQDFG